MHFCIRYHWNLHNTGTCVCSAPKIHTSPYWVPWGFCGPWPWVYYSCSGRCLHQQFPQIKRSMLLWVTNEAMGWHEPQQSPCWLPDISWTPSHCFLPSEPTGQAGFQWGWQWLPSPPSSVLTGMMSKTSAKSRQFTSAAFHVPHSLLSQPRGQL